MNRERKNEILGELANINTELDVLEQEIVRVSEKYDEAKIQDDIDLLQNGCNEIVALLDKIDALSAKMDVLEKEVG